MKEMIEELDSKLHQASIKSEDAQNPYAT